MIGGAGARQGILSVAMKDKMQVYNAYLSFVKNGGIFVATPKKYTLGDEVFVLMTLPESSERLPVAGKVVWITPPAMGGNRPAGIGIQFAESAEAEVARGKIENLLAGITNSDKPTHTM